VIGKRNLSQREVAGFLLGLGAGLILGIVFQPRFDDDPQERRGRDEVRDRAGAGLSRPRVAQSF
jgi:hypothetical protein